MTSELKQLESGQGFASLEVVVRFIGNRRLLKDKREVQDAMLIGEDGGSLGFTLWPELLAIGVGDGDTVKMGGGYITMGKYAPWKDKLIANLNKGEPFEVTGKEVGTPPPLPKEAAKVKEPPPPEEEAWDIERKGASLGGCLHDAAAIVAALIPRLIEEDALGEGTEASDAEWLVFKLACDLEERKAAYIKAWASGGIPEPPPTIEEHPAREKAPPVEARPASTEPVEGTPVVKLPQDPGAFYKAFAEQFDVPSLYVGPVVATALAKLDKADIERGAVGKYIMGREGGWAKAFEDLERADLDWASILVAVKEVLAK